MRPEARALGQALLDHHRARVKALPPGKNLILAKYTVSYGDLCSRAGAPHLTRVVGPFLGEIAEWCVGEGFPPLNSLAVNSATGMPGDGGLKSNDWHTQVQECIRFAGYPAKLP